MTELLVPPGGWLNEAEHLVVPHRRGKLTTQHVPKLDVAAAVHVLNSGAATLGYEWLSAADGMVVHVGWVSRAAGGVVVSEGTNPGVHVPVIPVRAAGPNRAVVMFACPACTKVCALLYLRSAGPAGEVTNPGPRCRRCSGLTYGSLGLLFREEYARELVIKRLKAVAWDQHAAAGDPR